MCTNIDTSTKGTSPPGPAEAHHRQAGDRRKQGIRRQQMMLIAALAAVCFVDCCGFGPQGGATAGAPEAQSVGHGHGGGAATDNHGGNGGEVDGHGSGGDRADGHSTATTDGASSHGHNGGAADGHGSAANGGESSHSHASGAAADHGGEEAAGLPTVAAWSTERAQAGQNTAIRIQILDEDGMPIEDFDIEHEKLLHLIVVSKDMSYFNHIHPEYNGQGEFTITNRFPAGGEYKLIADYVPTGGAKTTQTEWVTIEGAAAEPAALVPDRTHVKTVDGVEVELLDDHPAAGQDFELHFRLSDAATGEPVTDLEPYLGAVGHVVILSEDTEQYLHVHPLDDKAAGPDAKFATSFPHAGIYKVWAQFQRDGKMMTVPFVLNVN